jgi:hypothetical protein
MDTIATLRRRLERVKALLDDAYLPYSPARWRALLRRRTRLETIVSSLS